MNSFVKPALIAILFSSIASVGLANNQFKYNLCDLGVFNKTTTLQMNFGIDSEISMGFKKLFSMEPSFKAFTDGAGNKIFQNSKLGIKLEVDTVSGVVGDKLIIQSTGSQNLNASVNSSSPASKSCSVSGDSTNQLVALFHKHDAAIDEIKYEEIESCVHANLCHTIKRFKVGGKLVCTINESFASNGLPKNSCSLALSLVNK